MAKALVKQQGMEWAEVAQELYVSLTELRQILSGRNIIWSPDWITGVLRDLRRPIRRPAFSAPPWGVEVGKENVSRGAWGPQLDSIPVLFNLREDQGQADGPGEDVAT